MDKTALLELHLSSLRQSCLTLSAVSESLLSDQPIARQLRELASRLPGPSLEEPQPNGPLWTADQVLALSAAVRGSLDLLVGAAYFSELGGRIAAGLHATLDKVDGALGRRVREKVRARIFGLYVIIDPQVTAARDPLRVSEDALEGGARMIQLRDKARDKGDSLPLAQGMKELCDRHQALFIANDHADLARAAGAHGLHLGQHDLPMAEARRVLAPQQLIGRSNHLVEEALESQAQGADYVAVGSIFPTATKEDPRIGGLEPLRRVKAVVKVPVVAIGGITEANVSQVVQAGADAICVASAVGLAKDPTEAAARLVARIRSAGGKA